MVVTSAQAVWAEFVFCFEDVQVTPSGDQSGGLMVTA
jgi:hypothetical protein